MNATFKTVMLWMSLLVVIFLAWHFANIQKKEAPLTFSQFMQEVEEGKVEEVTITGTEIKGKHSPGAGAAAAATFKTSAPLGYEKYIDSLLARKVKVTIERDGVTDEILQRTPLVVAPTGNLEQYGEHRLDCGTMLGDDGLLQPEIEPGDRMHPPGMQFDQRNEAAVHLRLHERREERPLAGREGEFHAVPRIQPQLGALIAIDERARQIAPVALSRCLRFGLREAIEQRITVARRADGFVEVHGAGSSARDVAPVADVPRSWRAKCRVRANEIEQRANGQIALAHMNSLERAFPGRHRIDVDGGTEVERFSGVRSAADLLRFALG